MSVKKILERKIARQTEIVSTAREENRTLTDEERAEFDAIQRDIDELSAEDTEQTAGAAEERSADEPIRAERTRSSEITALCRSFGEDAQNYIDGGNSVEEVRAAILDKLRRDKAPVGNLRVSTDEGDKLRAAMADGLAMRCGVKVDKPADGASDFRSMSLRNMAIECLSRDGSHNSGELLRMDNDKLYYELSRQFFNPTAAFPAILDSTIKKTIEHAYNLVPTTFDQWVSTGSVSDFKSTPDHTYLIGGAGDFELVPEGGELKHDTPSTHLLPSRKIDTYGRQFTMSRQAFINDDIGFISEVPALYAQRAKKTINKQVYSLLSTNGSIFDGKALFCSDHGNYVSDGGAPASATIQNMLLMMQRQTDPFGEAITVIPEYLIVPVGYEFALRTLFASAQLPGTSNNDANPLYNYPIKTIQAPELNALAGENAVPWFMVANQASAKSIQVDYLNGQQMPTIRRMEVAGQLGFVWDIYMDWGICVRDWRGIACNAGAVIA